MINPTFGELNPQDRQRIEAVLIIGAFTGMILGICRTEGNPSLENLGIYMGLVLGIGFGCAAIATTALSLYRGYCENKTEQQRKKLPDANYSPHHV